MNPVLLHELSDDEDDVFCASHKVKVSRVLGPRICFTGERGSDETENRYGSLDARNREIIGPKSLPLSDSFVIQSKAKNKSLDEDEDLNTVVLRKRKARTYVLEDSDEENFRPAQNKHEEMQRKAGNIPMLMKQTVVIDITDEVEPGVAQKKAVEVTGEFRNLQKKHEGVTSEESRNVMVKQDLVIDDSDDGEFEPVQMKLVETSGNFRNAIVKQNAVVHDSDREFGPVLMKRKETPEGFRNVKMNQNNVDNDEAIARIIQEEEDLAEFGSLICTQDEETESQVDLIKNTLQKCDEIAASLRKELNVGGSITDSGVCHMDSYAEVDASAAKIVSQV